MANVNYIQNTVSKHVEPWSRLHSISQSASQRVLRENNRLEFINILKINTFFTLKLLLFLFLCVFLALKATMIYE